MQIITVSVFKNFPKNWRCKINPFSIVVIDGLFIAIFIQHDSIEVSTRKFYFSIWLFFYFWQTFVLIYRLIWHWSDYSHSDNWLILFLICKYILLKLCIWNRMLSAAVLSCCFALSNIYSLFALIMTYL